MNMLFGGRSKKNRYRIPRGMSASFYADMLIDDLKLYAEEVNEAIYVDHFCSALNKLNDIFDELIWLEKKKHVRFLNSAPSSDKKRIESNMSATITDFIIRAISDIKSVGEDWAWEIDYTISSFKKNEQFSSMLSDSHRTLIAVYSQRAKKISSKATLCKLGDEWCLDCSDIDAMDVIRAMEKNIDSLYRKFIRSGFSSDRGILDLEAFNDACESSTLPLAAEVRLEGLVEEYKRKILSSDSISSVDGMDGPQFEEWCAALLLRSGFVSAEITGSSGDQGVDIIAEKDGISYAVQCKCYSSNLSNKPVQEVYAGKAIHRCQIGVVMTNRYFTSGAKDAAEKTQVLLWDRDKLQAMLDEASGFQNEVKDESNG